MGINNINKFQSTFRNELSNQQKRAILGALICTAEADSKITNQEENVIEQIIDLLGIEMSDPFFIRPANMQEIKLALNSLDRTKQEWFLFALHTLIICDGGINEDETSFIIGFAKDMGISEYELVEIIQNYVQKSINKDY